MPAEPMTNFPNEAQLVALRAWYAGVSSLEAVERYLPEQIHTRQSSRGMIGQIRKQLIAIAKEKRQAAILKIIVTDRP